MEMEYKFVRSNTENGTLPSSGVHLLTNYDIGEKLEWMETNWPISIYAVTTYLALIYLGKKYMKNRKPFDLQNPLILWNFALAVFSFGGCYIFLPELIQDYREKDGWHSSVCTSWKARNPASLHWGFLFAISKVVELLDTAFIVLRKKPLIFLHWYHHVSVLLYCWLTYLDQNSTAAMFAIMNFVVHSVMYSYYGLRAMKIQIPSKISMLITSLQITQMVIGLAVILYASAMKINGGDCSVTSNSLWLALGMYASYFILFGNFFYKAYFGKGTKRNAVKSS